MKEQMRVWWIPQVPGNPFYVYVDSLQEAVRIMKVLERYDAFQYEQDIKPDYSNSGGVEIAELDGWTDWYDEETGEDDPIKYLKEITI